MDFQLNAFDIEKYDEILARGLSAGIGTPETQMCIEAAICNVLGMPHDDKPECVAAIVRNFKICLNDCKWSTPEARAKGLRDLGLAQLGSKAMFSDSKFADKILFGFFNSVLPELLDASMDKNWADQFRTAHSLETCYILNANYVNMHGVLDATYYVCKDLNYWHSDAGDAMSVMFNSIRRIDLLHKNPWPVTIPYTELDKYLILMAKVGLDTLKSLNSPGCKLL